MPFIAMPNQLKIQEGHKTIDAFLMDIIRVVRDNKVYGMYVVAFDTDSNVHGYQFNLCEEDYHHVGTIALMHKELYNAPKSP